jgi:hypothetical protein
MRQALFKCEMPRLKLKSSRSFLAIKRWQRTKSKKVIKHLRSSKLRWAHICAHSRIPVKEIEHQLSLGPDDLSEEDQFLLECNFDDITSTSGEAQGYWLLGIQAAREASHIRRKRREEAQSRPRKRQRPA